MSTRIRRLVARRSLVALVLAPARAARSAGRGEEGSKPPGLPAGMDWTFNFDATWGVVRLRRFAVHESEARAALGRLSDDWFEGSIKPALSAAYALEHSARSTARSAASASALTAPRRRWSARMPPRSTSKISTSAGAPARFGAARTLDFTFGRAAIRLGHGMLLWDGAAEGGTRGGYWTNARKAFELAAIGRFKPGNHTIEAFYLDKDDLPEADSGSKLWGVNYEYAFGEDTTLGATYMKWSADPTSAAARRARRLQPARVHGAVPETSRRCRSSSSTRRKTTATRSTPPRGTRSSPISST